MYALVVLDCASRRPFYDLPVSKRPLVKHASTKLTGALLSGYDTSSAHHTRIERKYVGKFEIEKHEIARIERSIFIDLLGLSGPFFPYTPRLKPRPPHKGAASEKGEQSWALTTFRVSPSFSGLACASIIYASQKNTYASPKNTCSSHNHLLLYFFYCATSRGASLRKKITR